MKDRILNLWLFILVIVNTIYVISMLKISIAITVKVMLCTILIPLWLYTIWHGIKINIHTGKIDFNIEIYSLRRFFCKKLKSVRVL